MPDSSLIKPVKLVGRKMVIYEMFIYSWGCVCFAHAVTSNMLMMRS